MDESRARELLDQERERLEAIREENDADEDAGLSGGPRMTEVDPMGADAGTEVFDRQVEDSVAGHADAELHEVQAAMQRLDVGTYGRCEECGAVIPDERLEVVPATRYCIDHQELAEVQAGVQERSVYGDPSLYT